MSNDGSSGQLNPSQALHLLTSARSVDKLSSDIASVLFTSNSKSPFRKYKDVLSPIQVKVVQDYLVSLRAQLVRVLEAQSVKLPDPEIASIHSIRTALAFARITFQDCTPEKMRGYGELPQSKVHEIHGLVDEMIAAIDKLEVYLSQDLEPGALADLARELTQVLRDTAGGPGLCSRRR